MPEHAASSDATLPRRLLREHAEKRVHSVWASPDGRFIAAGLSSEDHPRVCHEYVILDDSGTAGPSIETHLPEPGLVPWFAWSPTGDLFALGTFGFVYVSRVSNPSKIMSVSGHSIAAAFSPDGSSLAVLVSSHETSALSQLVVHDISTDREVTRVTIPPASTKYGDTPNDISWSPDGERIAITSAGCSIFVFHIDSCRFEHELIGHQNLIKGLTWISDRSVASASVDGTVRIWDAVAARTTHIVESHRSMGLVYSPSAKAILSWTEEGTLQSISTRDWSVNDINTDALSALGYYSIPLSANAIDHRIIMITGNGHRLEVAELDRIHAAIQPQVQARYSNVKVVLLGDTGVGKSGLALVLAGQEFTPTDSTHGRVIWRIDDDRLRTQDGSVRELMLWDLAGQPNYRLTHQLHLGNADLALVLFDARSETEPFAGVGHWIRALRQAGSQRPTDSAPTTRFLVAARTDRGTVKVSNARIETLIENLGFDGFFETSARECVGIDELRDAIFAAIDWDQVPSVHSSLLVAEVKNFLIRQKERGIALETFESLMQNFLHSEVPDGDGATGRTLLGQEGAADIDEGLDRLFQLFELCVGRIEATGLVNRLQFGELVLLQPELLDAYAGSIVNAAREEPDGLGSIPEEDVLAARFAIPQEHRPRSSQQEKLLVIATIEELLRHEVVLREETETGVVLVFPSEFRRDLPEAPGPIGGGIAFDFEGPVANIYATLIVRLSRSGRFFRTGIWRTEATFRAEVGGECRVSLVDDNEGKGRIVVQFEASTNNLIRTQFERFTGSHIDKRSIPGTFRRTRLFSCRSCGTAFSQLQVSGRQERGFSAIRCPVDDVETSLLDEVTDSSFALTLTAMNSSADEARDLAAATAVVMGKREIEEFDVFLCHNWQDKSAVLEIAKGLRGRGLLPWLDAWELPPGRPWQDRLESQISRIKSAAVFVGPNGFGPWQNQEVTAFLQEFAARNCPVIPVLLPTTAEQPQLPVFLRNMTWVDLRDPRSSLDRLVWGITGQRPPSIVED